VHRIFLLTGFTLLFLPQTVLSQEPYADPMAFPVGPQFQVEPPPFNPYPPLSTAQLPDQSSFPLGSQFQPPADQPQSSPPVYPELMPSATVDAMVLPPGTIEAPKTEPPPKLWEGGIELGLNGSQGNSQNFNLHFGARLKRKTEFNVLSSEFDYRQNSSDSVETVNKAFLDSRFEHLLQQSRWTWFVHNLNDYDEFKAYDLRVSLDAGFGYQLIKNDASSLIGRFGGGTTREIGGPDDEFLPEVVFGLEGEHKLNKRQKLTASVEHRPDVTDFTDYRLNVTAAWEILLDEEMHLSLKFGILDRYDSHSEDRKPNDLDYTMTLLRSL
jgi:putative salt-induced outer membrane protein YdiY